MGIQKKAVAHDAKYQTLVPGHVMQSVTCLTTDACLTGDPGVTSLIPAWSHIFVANDHENVYGSNLFPSIHSRRIVVSYKRKYVQEVLVNPLFKLTQEKSVVR